MKVIFSSFLVTTMKKSMTFYRLFKNTGDTKKNAGALKQMMNLKSLGKNLSIDLLLSLLPRSMITEFSVNMCSIYQMLILFPILCFTFHKFTNTRPFYLETSFSHEETMEGLHLLNTTEKVICSLTKCNFLSYKNRKLILQKMKE